MRNFGAADRMTKMMERFGLEEGEELEHPWLNKSVETAQKRVEQRNYSIRKRTLDFDDVMNKQREVVYGWRNEAINTDDPRPLIYEVIDEAIPAKVREHLGSGDDDEPNPPALLNWVNTTFPLGLTRRSAGFETQDAGGDRAIPDREDQEDLRAEVRARGADGGQAASSATSCSTRSIGSGRSISTRWMRCAKAFTCAPTAQKDPLIEYKNEAYEMFAELMANIKDEVLHNLFRSTSNLQAFEKFLATLPQFLMREHGPRHRRDRSRSRAGHRADETARRRAATAISEWRRRRVKLDLAPVRREMPKVGRNDPCPCGSGKKFKNCCGRLA